MIGLSLAAVGVTIALAQVFLTGRAVRRLGERDAASVGIIGAAIGFMIYAFTTSTLVAFAVLAAVAVQSLVQPSVMAMLSSRATPETQGEVQGIASMTTGIAGVIAPMVLTWPMAWFTGPTAPVHFPGVPFLISAGFALIALVLLRRLPASVRA